MAEDALSVVVPVYNSERTLQALAQRLEAALEPLDREYEIVLVNDGSADGSWAEIVALARADPRIRGLDLMHNYGQHNALLAGVRAARNAIAVTLDDDLQNPPEEIPKLLEKLAEGYDVVYGTAIEGRQGLLRNLATWLTKLALRAAIGGDIASKVSAYRAFRMPLRDAFANFEGPDVSLDVLLSWGSRHVAAVPVAHLPRAEGRSSYTVGRLGKHALDVLTGFSTRPLRAASLVGLAFTLFGFGVLVLVLVRYFAEGSPVPGFPFLASIISIFAGVQLLTLGVIGEYLARMHVRIMDRPAYAVREEVGGPDG
jgi:undecaprenyl-phosphate 4-deoxy-4-formamido-L-arabinose transferase